jgi:O-antigen/teichoic acid export membrane protein
MTTNQQPIAEAFSTEHLHADLKGRSVRGGVVTLTSQGAQFLIQSVATVVLARLLTPADFGLVAMVAAITGLGQSFADLGLSEATIQRESINHNQVSTLFWINTSIGFALMLVTAGLAPVLAWFYGEPRLQNITLWLSLTFLIGGLRVQHDALLKRQMRFISLGVRDVAAALFAVPLAIFMAWKGAGYWALITLTLTMNATQMALSWVMVRWLPSLPRRDSKVGSLISFGGKVAASYILINAHRNADSVLIGWRWGAGPVGLYSRALNLLMLPIRQLMAPARSVAIPAFSRTQGDPERFARYYLRMVNLIMWISTPIIGFLFVAAEPVIILALGSKWREAAGVFRILAISALGQLMFDSTIWVMVSRAESKRLLNLSVVIAPIIISSYAIGLPFGIKGVALSGSLVLVGISPWLLKYVYRGTNLTLLSLGRAIVYPVSLCVAAVLVGRLALSVVGVEAILPQLLVVALSFAAVYLSSALIRPIREEILSIGELSMDLAPSQQST